MQITEQTDQVIEILEANRVCTIFSVLAKFTDCIEVNFYPSRGYSKAEIEFLDDCKISLHRVFLEQIIYTKTTHLDFPVREFYKQLKKRLKDRKLTQNSFIKMFVVQRNDKVLISIPGIQEEFNIETKLNANKEYCLKEFDFGYENRSVACQASKFVKVIQKFKNKKRYDVFAIGTQDHNLNELHFQAEFEGGMDETTLELDEEFNEYIGPKLFSASFLREMLPIAKMSKEMRIKLEDIGGQPIMLEFEILDNPRLKCPAIIGSHEIYIACRGEI